MNFLSHYYLQKKVRNYYHNIGITLPDILSIHNSKIILGKINVQNILKDAADENQINLLTGMLEHIEADRIFHSSSFFSRGLKKLNTIAVENNIQKISEPIRHILFEILLDRYLLLKDEQIAHEFYSDYENLDTAYISQMINSLKNFNENYFTDFIKRFVFLKYIYHYNHFEGISDIIFRLSAQYNIEIKLTLQELIYYIEICYKSLISDIDIFFKLTI